MKLIPTASALLLAAAICGCGGISEKDLIGSYSGKLTMPESLKNNPAFKNAESMMSNLKLELKDDKTFTMAMGQAPIGGKWSFAGHTATLKIENIMGMSIDQVGSMAKGMAGAESIDKMKEPLHFTVSDGGKTLRASKAGFLAAGQDQGDLVFTKSQS